MEVDRINSREQTCCFTGHRRLPPELLASIRQRLKEAIVSLIHKGVRYFGAGGALGFDTLASEIVLKLKDEYPQIKLILVLPCANQSAYWSAEDVRCYEAIKTWADKVVCLADCYHGGCMHERNRHLVDHSGYCICYLSGDSGGTAYTVSYAKAQGLVVTNIADIGREE